MIFGLFGKKAQAKREPDRIWTNSARRSSSVAEEAAGAPRVLVVAHFPATREAVSKAIAARGGTCRDYDRFTSLSSMSDGIPVALAPALPPPGAGAKSEEEVLVLVAEHHFLPAEDDRVLAWCEASAFPCRVRFHESLDTPLLAMFAGENLTRLMKQLGMSDNEALENAMIDRAIRNAQEKIAASGPGDRPAASAAEWAQLNLRAAK